MTAKELFCFLDSVLSKVGEHSPVSICYLHKPCKTGRKCSTGSSWPVIDFDKIKDVYCKCKKKGSLSSVDGYTHNNNIFCFVEIKGWNEFLQHNILKLNQAKITKQANRYDFKKKLLESAEICRQSVHDENLFKEQSLAAIILTDIDTTLFSNFEPGLLSFNTNLQLLSQKEVKIEDICNTSIRKRMDTIPSEFNQYYISCWDFDRLMRKIR